MSANSEALHQSTMPAPAVPVPSLPASQAPRAAQRQRLYIEARWPRAGFRASIRGHILDLADPSASQTIAPTPDDLFVVSLASQVTWVARDFLRSHGLPEELGISATWDSGDNLPSPSDIELTITASRRAAPMKAVLLSVLENSLSSGSLSYAAVRVSMEGAFR